MNLTNEQIAHMVSTMTVAERKDWVQDDAFMEWICQHHKGTIEAATGIGKTRIGVMACARELHSNPNAVIYIMVPTTTLRDEDWPDEFRKWGHESLLKKVKIVCHSSMPKTKSKTGEVDLLVWDECHHATPQMSAFFNNNKVYKTLGLSATLPDGTRGEEDVEKKAIIDRYCPSIYKVTLEEAIALELIADFEVKTLLFKLDDTKIYNFGTEKKPLKRTEKEHYAKLSSALGQAMFNKKLAGLKFKRMQERRDFLINIESRLKLAKICMEKMLEPGKRTLIFCGSIEQSVALCGENVYNSKTSTKALDAFQRFEIDYLGAVDALDEGKNIRELDQILKVQGNSVSRRTVQRLGRMLRQRPGHKGLAVLLVAKDTADEKWYRTAYADFDKSRITEYNIAI